MSAVLADEGPLIVGASSTGLIMPRPGTLASRDQAFCHVIFYSPNSTADVDVPIAPTGWATLALSTVSEGGVVVGWMLLLAAAEPIPDEPDDDAFTLAWPTNGDENAATFAGRFFVVRGADIPIDGTPVAVAGPYTTPDGLTAAITTATTGGLIIHTVVSTGTTPVGAPPPNYTEGTAVANSTGSGAVLRNWYRSISGTVTEPALSTAVSSPAGSATGVYWIVTIAPADREVTPTPALGDFSRLALDCADSYQVTVTGADYRTAVGSVGWSTIEWSRVLDEISTATVTIPDRLGGARCCVDLGGLVPWRFGISIERNDRLVWAGPVTTVARQGESLRVTGSDVMARFHKRLVSRNNRNFTNVDSGKVFAALINGAQFSSDAWRFTAPIGLTGELVSREIIARDLELAYDVFSDMANSSVDFYVMNGVLFVQDMTDGWVYTNDRGDTSTVLSGPYTSAAELAYGVFTEQCWSQRPNWSINGMEQGNTVWIAGPDGGEEGVRRFWLAQDEEGQGFDGVLDFVDSNPLFRPEDGENVPDAVFQFAAESTLALRHIAPAIIEGGALAVGAPVDVDNLRPGSLWACDLFDACFGQLLQLARLKRVQVTATVTDAGITETIAPTLTPPGARE